MLLYLAVITIFLSLMLGFFNWRKNNFSLYLLAFYLITSLYAISHFYIFYEPEVVRTSFLYLHLSPLFLNMGVCLYFYVVSNLNNRSILENRWNYLHFIPSLIQFIALFKYYFLPYAYKLHLAKILTENPANIFSMNIPGVYLNGLAAIFARPMFIFIYTSISIYFLIVRNPLKDETFRPKNRRATKYQFIFIWILIMANWALSIGMMASILQVYFNPDTALNVTHIGPRNAVLTMLTSMMLSLLLFPTILYGIDPHEKKPEKLKNNDLDLNGQVNDDLLDQSQRLLEYMEQEKPYLNHKFNKSDLSLALQINPQDLAQIFDKILKQKFTSYKNALRVNHAKDLLCKGESERLSMEGIGKMSGFASRSSFYEIFKSETGLTPVEYAEKYCPINPKQGSN